MSRTFFSFDRKKPVVPWLPAPLGLARPHLLTGSSSPFAELVMATFGNRLSVADEI
jgi:hypothetical protein